MILKQYFSDPYQASSVDILNISYEIALKIATSPHWLLGSIGSCDG